MNEVNLTGEKWIDVRPAKDGVTINKWEKKGTRSVNHTGKLFLSNERIAQASQIGGNREMAIDDTVKVMNVLRFLVRLRSVEGNVTIKDGILTFEDGTTINLDADIFGEE